jgi:hypothetical protein
MQRILMVFFAVAVVLGVSFKATAQKKVKLGRVCGDPTVPCKGDANFQMSDLPFDTGKNFVIAESEWFYGIVLKSKKMDPEWGDCQKPSFRQEERKQIQVMFPHNQVFILNCVESGSNFYKGVADHIAFIGVFAGRTQAEANKFLKTVQDTKKFPGIRVRKMQVGINGT